METKPQPSDWAFNPITYSYVFLYAPPSGFCGCIDCKDQYHTLEAQYTDRFVYTNALSKAEARRICTGFATDIKSDLTFLRDAIQRHGNTILSRVSMKLLDAF
jgi:hypothetical protein